MALSRTESLLLEACRGRFAGVSQNDWPSILNLADLHEVAPIVWFYIASNLGPRVSGPLSEEASRHRAAGVIQQALELEETRGIINALGTVRPVVLKGHSLTEYYPPGARQERDIDILIQPDDYPHARLALEGIGYRIAPGLDEELQWRQTKDVAFCRSDRHGHSWSVELHWRLTEPGVPDRLSESVRRRAVTRDLDGALLHMPCPEHVLLLLAMNLRKHRFARLKSIVDVARLVECSRDQLDWSVLHKEAHQAGFCRLLIHALELSSAMMGFALPSRPWCRRTFTVGGRNSQRLQLLARIATADTVFGELRNADPSKTISGLIPFVSLDKFIDSLHLAYERLLLSPEQATYYRMQTAGESTNGYKNRFRFWTDTGGRLLRAATALLPLGHHMPETANFPDRIVGARSSSSQGRPSKVAASDKLIP